MAEFLFKPAFANRFLILLQTFISMQPIVIYLHGFLSSPASVKAQQTLKYVKNNLPGLEIQVPKLSNYPGQAISQLDRLVKSFQGRDLRFIGSSMGGYLSTYLVEIYGGRAVLINPAVHPDKLLQDYLGEHTNPYTDEEFTLDESHAQALANIKVATFGNPKNYCVLLQTGDETLDYREATDKYVDATLIVEQGGDHSFQGYENHLPVIFEFLLR